MTLTLSPDELALIPKPPANLDQWAEHMWTLLRAAQNIERSKRRIGHVMLHELIDATLDEIDRDARGE